LLKIEGGERGEESAYGVVDVRTDHETVATAICTVVDGNDVAGLFIVRMGGRVESDGMNESGIVFVRFRLVSDRYDRSVEVKQLRTTISSDMAFVGKSGRWSVFAGWKGRWEEKEGAVVKKGKEGGLSDGFYMPEKKIINDMMALFSRQPGMHAAFARPFFSPNLFLIISPQQSQENNTIPPPERPVKIAIKC
jgi:hypothetical protein